MRKAPEITVPTQVDALMDHIGGNGVTFNAVTAEVVEEILTAGRLGLYVDSDDETANADPRINIYYAENIINWRTADIKGEDRLILVVLKENVMERTADDDDFEEEQCEQFRVLQLITTEGDPYYQVQVWHQEDDDQSRKEDDGWIMDSEVIPVGKGGARFTEIPFTFITPTGTGTDIENSPIIDLVNVNLSHYRNSADLEHGLHFTALPTAWVAGFTAKQTGKLQIGSSVAWVSDNPEAKAGFLEFTGAGLGAIQQRMDKKELQMAVLGARLLEQQKAGVETAEAIRLRQTGESATLSSISTNAGQGLAQALKWIAQWIGAAVDTIKVALNQDFMVETIDAPTLTVMLQALQSGKLSFDTWFFMLKRTGMIPDNWTIEKEKSSIQANDPAPPPGVPIAGDALDKLQQKLNEKKGKGAPPPKPGAPAPKGPQPPTLD